MRTWRVPMLLVILGWGVGYQIHQLHARTPGEHARAESAPLAVRDLGIFNDLDDRVTLRLPGDLDRSKVQAVVDRAHHLLILYVDGWPTKPYPLDADDAGPALVLGTSELALRPGDRRELEPLLTSENLRVLPRGRTPEPGDADGDGIPDPLDLLMGAHKTALNQASYGAGYMKIDYPMGDVPRDVGVCTDVVVRAVRNAGLDLQSALHRDIQRARRAYPMVRSDKGNKHIDHRRVKTLLPYFERHWDERRVSLEDPDDPLRPGDIVFMDTFPSRSGPDHIGILSDERGESGLPLVINNWTDGYHTMPMDLLGWVPVTHRFRFPSR